MAGHGFLRPSHVLRDPVLRQLDLPPEQLDVGELGRREVAAAGEEAEGEGGLPSADPEEGALEWGEPRVGDGAEEVGVGEASLSAAVVAVVDEEGVDGAGGEVGPVGDGVEEFGPEVVEAGEPGVEEGLHGTARPWWWRASQEAPVGVQINNRSFT